MEDGSFEEGSMEDDVLYQAAEDFSQQLRAGSGGNKRPMEDFIEDKLEDLPTLKRARPSDDMWGGAEPMSARPMKSWYRLLRNRYNMLTASLTHPLHY